MMLVKKFISKAFCAVILDLSSVSILSTSSASSFPHLILHSPFFTIFSISLLLIIFPLVSSKIIIPTFQISILWSPTSSGGAIYFTPVTLTPPSFTFSANPKSIIFIWAFSLAKTFLLEMSRWTKFLECKYFKTFKML